jgi:hypothetical protein
MAPSLNSSESSSSSERKPWRREEKRRYDIEGQGQDRKEQDRIG